MRINPLPYVFIGDSVTEAGRFEDPRGLGYGYVQIIAERLRRLGSGATVLNRGVSGNRVPDLAARWHEDCLELKPKLVSIAVGVNDTWRRYDSNDPTSVTKFEEGYRALLESLCGLAPQVVLMEPFLLPVSADQEVWREDLDPKIAVVRTLADEFGATLVATDDFLNARRASPQDESLAPDGVHPSASGHEAIATLWLNTVVLPKIRSAATSPGGVRVAPAPPR